MSNCTYCGGITEHHRFCVAQRLTSKGVFRADKKSYQPGERVRPNATSRWIQHVKAYQDSHPGMSYGVAMSEAKKTYQKS